MLEGRSGRASKAGEQLLGSLDSMGQKKIDSNRLLSTSSSKALPCPLPSLFPCPQEGQEHKSGVKPGAVQAVRRV